MAKIEKLSAESEALLPDFRERWRSIGLSVGPSDRALSADAVRRAYARIDRPAPIVLHARGPLDAIFFACVLRTQNGQLGGQLWGQIRGQLWDQLGGQFEGQLRGQLRGQLWGQIRDQLRGVYSAIWSYGQTESYWASYYRFAIEHAGVTVTDRQRSGLAIWEDLARSCSLVLSWSGVTIVVDHPQALLFNEQRRLHSVVGPAISYADGYAVYAVNGVRIDPGIGEALLAGRLTTGAIRDLRNVEVRRVAIERYESVHGKGAYLVASGAQVLHEDVDQHGRPRKLLRIELGDDEPYVGVQVTNSSPEPDGSYKQYVLRVDPELRPLPRSGRPSGDGQAMTCHNAVASTFGRRGEEYAPVMET